MTPRIFSIIRRRPGIIDLIATRQPDAAGVVKYRLKSASDPADTFSTTVLDSSIYGFTDPTISSAQTVIQPGDHVRIVFNPNKYGLTDSYFWLELVYVDSMNSEMTDPAPSAPTLVPPPFVGNEQVGFNSTAPSGSDITDSLRIDLPRLMSNFRVRNLDTSNDLYVAFQEGGPEVVVPAVGGYQESIGFDGNVSSLWVRGSGGSSKFSAQFTYANPR